MNTRKLGEKIRKIRATKGLSQSNVAEDVGISFGAYAKIERGETDVNINRLMQIAKSLDVNITDFFDSSVEIKENKNPYGYASKEELDSLKKDILKEFEKLRHELLLKGSVKKKTYKIKKSSKSKG